MTRRRIARLRTELQERGLDALIITSLPHIRYLTHFSGSHALCIVTARNAFFVTDSRYNLQSRQEVRGFRCTFTSQGLFEGASRRNLLARCKRVGFEAQHISYAQYRLLKKTFPSILFHSTSDILDNMMVTKDREEVASIKEAIRISEQAFTQVVGEIRPGMEEREIASVISYVHKKLGAERDGFEPIVASGERGSMPHARASSKRVKRGEFVTLDFGCVVNGYHSDITRTVAIGRVSAKQREMYRVVQEAHHAAIAAARSEISARELDAVARNVIKQAGYGKYFIHSLGHGIGLLLHERPRIAMTSKEELRAGSVVTIEPGLYIPGFGGVRIEDDVHLTARGCTVLTTLSTELLIL